jgi:hypothetical protein
MNSSINNSKNQIDSAVLNTITGLLPLFPKISEFLKRLRNFNERIIYFMPIGYYLIYSNAFSNSFQKLIHVNSLSAQIKFLFLNIQNQLLSWHSWF